ncbi:nucleoside hydrolase [Photobacterium sanctipauli]|uniref:Nucleoside hydrolase n=1 Tax=Photobacterium sanctipauli TaxID=1342794 RepID=A0A2T3NWS0_9GAMM|nr:nucleoside hydrolase [Photobacterium sanctipauli]PSW20659.1 nucleoside hydrolase [Photobacterium sanctipauli]
MHPIRKVIIDTDIGDDADDALAIALATQLSNIQLLGISTVFENTHLRAKMAKYLLAQAGVHNIPVFAGDSEPGVTGNTCSKVPCQYQEKMNQYEFDGTDVMAFYEKLLTENEQVAIIAIGPLTNIARLITEKPHLLNNSAELIIMGGCFYHHANEWNIVCDPESAQIVVSSGLNIKMIGLDVTTQCEVSSELIERAREKACTPLQQLVIECCDAWKAHSGFSPILHDPLTVLALSDERYLSYQKEDVKIELKGEHTRGATVISEDRLWGREPATSNVVVGYRVDAQQVIREFFDKVFSMTL